jgi:hypothetical protein
MMVWLTSLQERHDERSVPQLRNCEVFEDRRSLSFHAFKKEGACSAHLQVTYRSTSYSPKIHYGPCVRR